MYKNCLNANPNDVNCLIANYFGRYYLRSVFTGIIPTYALNHEKKFW